MNQAFDAYIITHVLAVAAAIVAGGLAFAARKGSLMHRLAGRTWVALMLVAAISSFWIRSSGSFSWVHVLSIVVPVLLGLGVVLALKGRMRGHRITMVSIYAFGLGVPGLFALFPQRLLGQMLWSGLGLI